jgi:hypothetical protein
MADKLVGSEKMIIIIVAPHRGETSRHVGISSVRQSCRFAPIKKLPCLPMLPSKNPHEPNPFPETHPAPGVLHFLPVSIGCRSVVENSGVQHHAGQAI